MQHKIFMQVSNNVFPWQEKLFQYVTDVLILPFCTKKKNKKKNPDLLFTIPPQKKTPKTDSDRAKKMPGPF